MSAAWDSDLYRMWSTLVVEHAAAGLIPNQSTGDGALSIESYFVTVPVSSHCIIDPVLKLRISTGHWEPDPTFRGGSIWI